MHIESFIYKSVITTVNYAYTVVDTTSYRRIYDGKRRFCAHIFTTQPQCIWTANPSFDFYYVYDQVATVTFLLICLSPLNSQQSGESTQ